MELCKCIIWIVGVKLFYKICNSIIDMVEGGWSMCIVCYLKGIVGYGGYDV